MVDSGIVIVVGETRSEGSTSAFDVADQLADRALGDFDEDKQCNCSSRTRPSSKDLRPRLPRGAPVACMAMVTAATPVAPARSVDGGVRNWHVVKKIKIQQHRVHTVCIFFVYLYAWILNKLNKILQLRLRNKLNIHQKKVGALQALAM